MFSIDPGTKHLGLVIFLDDYYLNSHTIYDRDRFIEKIRIYINALQGNNLNPLKLIFKFGKGIMPITLNLIEQIFIKFTTDNGFDLVIRRILGHHVIDADRPVKEAAEISVSQSRGDLEIKLFSQV